ncbi:hypothetical protein BJ912DRAFT_1018733 [Pholiota molesta]|nr:hypothetical protein BJ912DRAFT_1018733 [Pholiota molesta]
MCSAPLKRPSRASHVGSLLRPKELFEKRKNSRRDKTVLKLQQELGITTITDGELRRAYFFEGVFDRLEGMTYIPNRSIATFKPYIPHCKLMHAAGLLEAESVYCTGKIRRTRPFYDVHSIKLTICSPSWFHQRHGSDLTYDLSVYENDEEYFGDLGKAYREEMKDWHIQIDDPTFCYFCHEDMIIGMERAGVDHEALLDTYIRAINGGVHYSEGGYGRIALKLFNTLDVDVFYLEYDTERAGDFTPLAYLPLGKVVVLGLVTTKNPKLESVEELKMRVNEAVEVLCQGSPKRSREHSMWFASVWEGNPVTEEDQRKKLSVLVEAAKQIWKST